MALGREIEFVAAAEFRYEAADRRIGLVGFGAELAIGRTTKERADRRDGARSAGGESGARIVRAFRAGQVQGGFAAIDAGDYQGLIVGQDFFDCLFRVIVAVLVTPIRGGATVGVWANIGSAMSRIQSQRRGDMSGRPRAGRIFSRGFPFHNRMNVTPASCPGNGRTPPVSLRSRNTNIRHSQKSQQ